MGAILKNLDVIGIKGKGKFEVLFDTGAARSLVKWSKAEKISSISKAIEPLELILGDKSRMKVDHFANLSFVLNGHRFPHFFYVARRLPIEMIIGLDLMQLLKIELIPEKEAISFDPKRLDLWLV